MCTHGNNSAASSILQLHPFYLTHTRNPVLVNVTVLMETNVYIPSTL